MDLATALAISAKSMNLQPTRLRSIAETLVAETPATGTLATGILATGILGTEILATGTLAAGTLAAETVANPPASPPACGAHPRGGRGASRLPAGAGPEPVLEEGAGPGGPESCHAANFRTLETVRTMLSRTVEMLR